MEFKQGTRGGMRGEKGKMVRGGGGGCGADANREGGIGRKPSRQHLILITGRRKRKDLEREDRERKRENWGEGKVKSRE